LKSSLGQFYGCHYVSVNRCGISVSKMTTDIFRLSSLQSRPSPNHGITKFVISVTWRVSLVEQDLLIMLVHLSLPPSLVVFVLVMLSYFMSSCFCSVSCCPLRYPRINYVQFVFTPICFVEGSVLCVICIYLRILMSY